MCLLTLFLTFFVYSIVLRPYPTILSLLPPVVNSKLWISFIAMECVLLLSKFGQSTLKKSGFFSGKWHCDSTKKMLVIGSFLVQFSPRPPTHTHITPDKLRTLLFSSQLIKMAYNILYLVYAAFTWVILDFTSLWHLPSVVIKVPKYMKNTRLNTYLANTNVLSDFTSMLWLNFRSIHDTLNGTHDI